MADPDDAGRDRGEEPPAVDDLNVSDIEEDAPADEPGTADGGAHAHEVVHALGGVAQELGQVPSVNPQGQVGRVLDLTERLPYCIGAIHVVPGTGGHRRACRKRPSRPRSQYKHGLRSRHPGKRGPGGNPCTETDGR